MAAALARDVTHLFALAPGSESTAIVSPAAEKVRRHPKYYLNGGDVHFLVRSSTIVCDICDADRNGLPPLQVENYIFRVHRYFFERESLFFREKLGAPPPPGQPPKGSSDVNPFPLDDVHEEDFSRFLWVFYNPYVGIIAIPRASCADPSPGNTQYTMRMRRSGYLS